MPTTGERREQTLGELCRDAAHFCEERRVRLFDLDSLVHAIGAERKDTKHLIKVLKSLGTLAQRTRTVFEWKGLAKMCQFVGRLEAENRPMKKLKFKSTKQRLVAEQVKEERDGVLLNLTQDCMQTYKRKEKSWGKLSLKLAVFFIQTYKAMTVGEITLALTRKYVHSPLKLQTQVRPQCF